MTDTSAPAPAVEVLMPTLCSAARRASIERAIESILSQTGCVATPVLVINGERFDPQFRSELEQRPGLRVHHLPEPDLFAARRFARRSVSAEFFGWLDDDDVYLQGALQRRLAPLLSDPALDVVVSNGWIVEGEKTRPLFEDAAAVASAPLAALMKANWLGAAGGLYRTASVSPDYFDASVRSLDMTFLAFRLALERKIAFVAEPTFRKNRTPGSVSASVGWMLPAAGVLERMSTFPMDPALRRALLRKLSAAHHDIAEHYRNRGDAPLAWRHHLRSVSGPSGLWRYGPYTRKLLGLSLRRALERDRD
ncbi:MAG: glycosyltransferase family 2 protein [Burkholderiaceae bacterium]|nr:glycosyltransferase family 2 protein [Burkholderiaceae bacterium]